MALCAIGFSCQIFQFYFFIIMVMNIFQDMIYGLIIGKPPSLL